MPKLRSLMHWLNYLLLGVCRKKRVENINTTKPPVHNKWLRRAGFWPPNSSGALSNEVMHRAMFWGIPAYLLPLQFSFLHQPIFKGGEVRIARLPVHEICHRSLVWTVYWLQQHKFGIYQHLSSVPRNLLPKFSSARLLFPGTLPWLHHYCHLDFLPNHLCRTVSSQI